MARLSPAWFTLRPDLCESPLLCHSEEAERPKNLMTSGLKIFFMLSYTLRQGRLRTRDGLEIRHQPRRSGLASQAYLW